MCLEMFLLAVGGVKCACRQRRFYELAVQRGQRVLHGTISDVVIISECNTTLSACDQNLSTNFQQRSRSLVVLENFPLLLHGHCSMVGDDNRARYRVNNVAWHDDNINPYTNTCARSSTSMMIYDNNLRYTQTPARGHL